MRRPLAAGAEVVFCRHQPTSKMLLPDTVDHHARHERVAFPREPVGQLQASATGLTRQRLLAQDVEIPAWNLVAEFSPVAANLDA